MPRRHAQVLMVGAILTPGRRTLTSVLPIMGRAHERRFVNVHRILTAVWRHGGMPVVPIRWVLIRDPEICTDLTQEPVQIVSWFVRRWCVEVTFQEVRTHLGVETQRQWSHRAIARTTPCLLALFSIVTLLATRLPARQRRCVATAAWYPKPRPTFADALAAVRCAIWRERALAIARRRRPRTKLRFRLPAPWAYALCHAA